MTSEFAIAMIGAGAGLFGVLIGAGITWFQTYWMHRQERDRSARYLAIRIVCILDKFVENCVAVVKDDGLSYGQRTEEGCLSPQVKSPGAPVYPDDVDWKTIDHELMCKLLSLPSDVEATDNIINNASEHSCPPDYEEFFEARAFWYACSGMTAYKLAQELSKKYGIRKKTYVNWNPAAELEEELRSIRKRCKKHDKESAQLIDKILEAA